MISIDLTLETEELERAIRKALAIYMGRAEHVALVSRCNPSYADGLYFDDELYPELAEGDIVVTARCEGARAVLAGHLVTEWLAATGAE